MQTKVKGMKPNDKLMYNFKNMVPGGAQPTLPRQVSYEKQLRSVAPAEAITDQIEYPRELKPDTPSDDNSQFNYDMLVGMIKNATPTGTQPAFFMNQNLSFARHDSVQQLDDENQSQFSYSKGSQRESKMNQQANMHFSSKDLLKKKKTTQQSKTVLKKGNTMAASKEALEQIMETSKHGNMSTGNKEKQSNVNLMESVKVLQDEEKANLYMQVLGLSSPPSSIKISKDNKKAVDQEVKDNFATFDKKTSDFKAQTIKDNGGKDPTTEKKTHLIGQFTEHKLGEMKTRSGEPIHLRDDYNQKLLENQKSLKQLKQQESVKKIVKPLLMAGGSPKLTRAPTLVEEFSQHGLRATKLDSNNGFNLASQLSLNKSPSQDSRQMRHEPSYRSFNREQAVFDQVDPLTSLGQYSKQQGIQPNYGDQTYLISSPSKTTIFNKPKIELLEKKPYLFGQNMESQISSPVFQPHDTVQQSKIQRRKFSQPAVQWPSQMQKLDKPQAESSFNPFTDQMKSHTESKAALKTLAETAIKANTQRDILYKATKKAKLESSILDPPDLNINLIKIKKAQQAAFDTIKGNGQQRSSSLQKTLEINQNIGKAKHMYNRNTPTQHDAITMIEQRFTNLKERYQLDSPSNFLVNGGHRSIAPILSPQAVSSSKKVLDSLKSGNIFASPHGRRSLLPLTKRNDYAMNYQASYKSSMDHQPNIFRRQNGDNTHMANNAISQNSIARTNLSPTQSRKLLM